MQRHLHCRKIKRDPWDFVVATFPSKEREVHVITQNEKVFLLKGNVCSKKCLSSNGAHPMTQVQWINPKLIHLALSFRLLWAVAMANLNDNKAFIVISLSPQLQLC